MEDQLQCEGDSRDFVVTDGDNIVEAMGEDYDDRYDVYNHMSDDGSEYYSSIHVLLVSFMMIPPYYLLLNSQMPPKIANMATTTQKIHLMK